MPVQPPPIIVPTIPNPQILAPIPQLGNLKKLFRFLTFVNFLKRPIACRIIAKNKHIEYFAEYSSLQIR